MNNIVSLYVTRNCNLHCHYCFNQCFSINKPEISLDDLSRLLDFLGKDTYIVIMGGEPTVCSNFIDICNAISKNGNPSHIHTNGIELYKYWNDIPSNIGISVSLNPENILKNNYDNLLKSLDTKNRSIGYNSVISLNHSFEDINSLVELIVKNKINNICASVASPLNNFIDREEYYKNIKIKFIYYLNKLINNSISYSIGSGCNHIPLCFFTQEEITKFKIDFGMMCDTPVCIAPDLEVFTCSIAHTGKKLTDFNSLDEAFNYVNTDRKRITELLASKSSSCINCDRFNSGSCKVGCVYFR